MPVSYTHLQLTKVESGNYTRMDTGIGELNRVLGGGLVKGSLTLISGEPGIGKSTIIIQAAANIAKHYGKVLYVSGEESEDQIKMRADRVCRELPDDLFILSETNMENIFAAAEELKPAFVIIDSIQTMYTGDLESAPGSVSQVRACGNELMRMGKSCNIPIFIVAHVTKSGELAGPKICLLYTSAILAIGSSVSSSMVLVRLLSEPAITVDMITAIAIRTIVVMVTIRCLIPDFSFSLNLKRTFWDPLLAPIKFSPLAYIHITFMNV